MKTKVLMVPHLSKLGSWESGIARVIEKYFKYLPNFGIEMVEPDSFSFDIIAAHAGSAGDGPVDVCHCHGLYWTAEFPKVDQWQFKANRDVVRSIRNALTVTVPSSWVAETLRRDMHLDPLVVPHGIDPAEWRHSYGTQADGYVLWNKNRNSDVCDPTPVVQLAARFPQVPFVTTFLPKGFNPENTPPNLKVIGLQKHGAMAEIIKKAWIYLSTPEETFGIGVLEAMSASKPVLAYDYGGNSDLVVHGETGYLAKPGNLDDLSAGLSYCMKFAPTLGGNGTARSFHYSWENVASEIAEVYREASSLKNETPKISVVIPCYNYARKLPDAVRSAFNQTRQVDEIIIVDDGSTDETAKVAKALVDELGPRVRFLSKENGGVATARNAGIEVSSGDYILCLDADDRIEPQFIEATASALDRDRSLGIAYTGLLLVEEGKEPKRSDWPGPFSMERQLKRINQIPTASLFRREAWRRVGGYKQRFAPNGAGSEDAHFWTSILTIGYGAKMATDAPLFRYSYGSGLVSGNRHYQEIDWLYEFPESRDHLHSFASPAKPLNGLSHPVRQYNHPDVSVIIPVGPGHQDHARRAIESVEAQTYRKWEVIVVDDTGSTHFPVYPEFPFARTFSTNRNAGAGAARNLGVKHARANLLLFLDADDWLHPSAITEMVRHWNETRSIIYTNYVYKAIVEKSTADDVKSKGLLRSYDKTTGEMIAGHRWTDYECSHFQRSIKLGKFYHWCLVTCLVPKAWHEAIGGFDEAMPSWEDVDYFWRLAWSGRCFSRLPKELVMYRFYTGNRRELANAETPEARETAQKLIQYIYQKIIKEDPMPCGCKKDNVYTPSTISSQTVTASASNLDESMVLVTYALDAQGRANKAQHEVRGNAKFSQKISDSMVRTSDGWAFIYGYRSVGEKFYVHAADIKLRPDRFVPVQTTEKPIGVPEPTTALPEAPSPF